MAVREIVEIIEGGQQGRQDAPHWVRVYTELIGTLEGYRPAVPGLAHRVAQFRERLAYWHSIAGGR
jgi:hypothetical protein